jgi:hypothetical protein
MLSVHARLLPNRVGTRDLERLIDFSRGEWSNSPATAPCLRVRQACGARLGQSCVRFVTWHKPGIQTVADDRFCRKLSPTPIAVSATEELGSIPDTSVANCGLHQGGRGLGGPYQLGDGCSTISRRRERWPASPLWGQEPPPAPLPRTSKIGVVVQTDQRSGFRKVIEGTYEMSTP